MIVAASSKRRLTELHLVAARERAMRLFATTSAIFPTEWAKALVIEQTVVDVSEFAYHSRRVLDLCGLWGVHFPDVDALRFKLAPGQDITFIPDFREAVNRLHHAVDLKFNWAIWEGEKVFLASEGDMVVSFVKVTTDKLPEANISLFGVAVSFLNGVIPAVKAKLPDYQF